MGASAFSPPGDTTAGIIESFDPILLIAQPWVALSVYGGRIPANSSITVDVFITEAADALAIGNYTDIGHVPQLCQRLPSYASGDARGGSAAHRPFPAG